MTLLSPTWCLKHAPLFIQIRSRATTFVVEFLERFTVENPQQLPVTIYDYYDPGKYTLDCNFCVYINVNVCFQSHYMQVKLSLATFDQALHLVYLQ